MQKTYSLEIGKNYIGKDITLYGWVNSRRDHGGIIFIDLRDSKGIVQIVIDPNVNSDIHEQAENIRDEYVLMIKGKVRARGENLINPNIATGEIEVVASNLEIINRSKPMPFTPNDPNVNEEIRLKYRYLDLRNPNVNSAIKLRSKVYQNIRETLSKLDFTEIETPILTKATPEGARDYLVPSRVNSGTFYALPQSPQLFKQLFMVAGFDKYYQIAKCFRDEDLRADRQPEFTQLDIELSFTSPDEIMNITENILKNIFKSHNQEIKTPFQRMEFNDAMEFYGSDKPDLRFDMKFIDILECFIDSSNDIFKDIASDKETNRIKAIKVVDGDNSLSRKDLKELEKYVCKFGAKGLAYFQFKEGELKGPLIKFLDLNAQKRIIELTQINEGDIIFIGAGTHDIVHDYMGRLRIYIAKKLNLIDSNELNFLWVTNFPMFESQDGKIKAMHHPFTMPDDINKNPLKMNSIAYDIILNGIELGGGSMRIHKENIQEKIFEILGLSKEEQDEKFGFFTEALKYGTPPHGGVALGLDRLIMLIANKDSIRDVIAFPKTQKAQCSLTDAPSLINEQTLNELSIKIKDK